MRAKFINEKIIKGSVWRKTDQDWLRIFLDQDQIIYPAKEDKFISLSYDSESGSQDDFGGAEVTIEFDKNKIMNQGAEPVYYEAEWFEEFPKACIYITGYESEEDYYEQKGYSGPEEANENMELTWDQYVEDYKNEQEILIKKLRFEPGLIKYVTINTLACPILIEMLEENKIPYKAKAGIDKLKENEF